MSETNKQWPLVDPRDGGIRPAGSLEHCFYCKQKVGSPHLDDCVMVKKKVKMRAVIEYEEEFPFSWDKRQIEFHHNDGTWCSDNFLSDLPKIMEKSGHGCACSLIKFEYMSEDDTPSRDLHSFDQSKN